MTAGFAVVLGQVGKNFASGMSGGAVFVVSDHEFDPSAHGFSLGPTPCRFTSAREDDPDVARLHALLQRYAEATGSWRAMQLLADWPEALTRFGKLSLALDEPAPSPEPTLVSTPP